MPAIKVKKATEQADLDKINQIRYEVFVVEQNCPPHLEVEYNDESVHFLATVNGEPAGACRWRKTEKGCKLERFAVLKNFRGYGLGQEMVKTVLADLPADAGYVYLNSQTHAVPFYKKLGFETSGPEFEEAGIKHYQMVKK
ncbi:putative GNAT family N-acyltransferase [Mucilaginibacter oryzae]|uniref:Putative GNAT family N-acyltransferase n=1 Tax=Mucilaginibacter oryzae TaxID=468058 RepID=A0A316HFL6_9SPHI|nr:GNAT family N-acetyltransferase [Mucilaginibacter oryzae]PWK78841.1 putative GNAT family N-acyltransferase [Mucilaginibacter oryzae]